MNPLEAQGTTQGGGEKDPWIKIIEPPIISPSLKDNTADADRLIKGVKKALGSDRVSIDFSLLKALPNSLRACQYRPNAAVFQDRTGSRLIDIFPWSEHHDFFGLAVDLGTSTVVVRIVHLDSLQVRDETSFQNPQIEMGTDILTRIHSAAEQGGLVKLQRLLVERLNEEIHLLARRHKTNATSILGMSVAGNTAMTHLFLGLDPYWICREPYIPVINAPDLLRAADIGVEINPGAPVLVFPNVGSYFGGDLIAGILASKMWDQSQTSILVDVGTNAEVVVGNRDWLVACAGAAGPALEGGVASMGMMAGPGVIDKVAIDHRHLEFRIRTIGGLPPIGICGSGLIDLVAQLFLARMIDLRGKFVVGKCGDALIDLDGVKHLIIVPSGNSATGETLTLAQTDIDALIRSKAAMFTILTTITNAVNVPMRQLERFYVAGTFGYYIDPKSAVTIGMLPDLPLETYVTLGNTSIEGATMALQSVRAKERIFRIRDQITYMELNVNQEFMNLFSAARFIPHTDRSLFPSVKERAP